MLGVNCVTQRGCDAFLHRQFYLINYHKNKHFFPKCKGATRNYDENRTDKGGREFFLERGCELFAKEHKIERHYHSNLFESGSVELF